jgi:hypothetical protein
MRFDSIPPQARRSWRNRLLLISAAITLASCVGQAQPRRADSPMANAVVLIIRHGEKPDDGDQLAPAGVARANDYVKYFEDYKVDGQPLHLDHLFATKDSKGSARERLTIEPLAQALGLKIDNRYKNKEYSELATDMKTHSYGHEMLICWHHGTIPELITALGGDAAKIIGAAKWPGSHFDWVVELHYDADGHVIPAQTTLVHEHLMPGDSK